MLAQSCDPAGRTGTRLLVGLFVAVLLAGCGDGSATPAPHISPTASPIEGTVAGTSPPVSSSPSGGPAIVVPAAQPSASSNGPKLAVTFLAVVTGFDNYTLNSMTSRALVRLLAAGQVMVPCGVEADVAANLGTTQVGWAACVSPNTLASRLGRTSKRLGLLPPGLVGPGLKVVPLDGADLFGEGPARSRPYPLQRGSHRAGARTGPPTTSRTSGSFSRPG